MEMKNYGSNVPVWSVLPETENEVVDYLRSSSYHYGNYCRLNAEWRTRFLDFCRGKKSLPLTYDPFFKWIFHPDIHADRLSGLVSSLLGVKVKIVHLLPNEDSMMGGDTLLIMDLLGEVEDGSLVNIEIQKQSYAFPAERISCYSADLVMRQYARVKGQKGRGFTYRDIKKVYVIVIFERSMGMFHEMPDRYIHYGKTIFNTGLKMELLQEYCLIALDVFTGFPYAKEKGEQTAWLSLLVTENLADAEQLIQEYPWLEDIYKEIAMLRQNPGEVLEMFSEALRILDENTVKYMIEELQKKVEEQDAVIDKKDAEIEELKRQLEQQERKKSGI